MADMVSIKVDGRELQAEKGTLLWEACRAHGIDIPIFCYHTKLGPVGACRTCLVELEGNAKGPITACTTPVTDGMVVRTKSPVVEKAQRGVLEFLLLNHPLDCPICDRGGECPLQDQVFAYGPGTSRYIEPKRHHVKPIMLGPTIALDRERCVLCWRCVRFCADIAEDKSIILLDRGDHSMVGTFQGEPYVSNFSGNVIELCPVGALTSRQQRFQFRPWELQNRPSICPHCPVGCNINISVRKNDEVIRFQSRDNPEVDDGWLCDRGRFNHEFIGSPGRLKSPLVRRGDAFVEVPWEEALGVIAERLHSVVEEHGPDSVGGIASPTLTNEDLFVFRRFLNDVIGSRWVDHFPRAESVLGPDDAAATRTLDRHLMSIEALESSRTVVLLGADPSRREPVVELRVRKAINTRGAKLVVVGEEVPLAGKAAAWLRLDPSQLAGTARQLADAIREMRAGSQSSATEDGAGDSPAPITPRQLATQYLAEGPIAILYDDSLEGVSDKGDALRAVADLVNVLAESGEVGVLPMLDASNSMGARNIGLFPDGGQPAWGPQLLRRIGSGDVGVRAALIAGANPLGDHSLTGTREALAGLDLLVVQDMFLTETAKLAHVVLPTASFAEKRGTLTNTECRVQAIDPAVPAPGIARPDWEILVDLSQRFERPLDYASPDQVWEAMSADLPAFRGTSRLDIGPRGLRLARAEAALV